MAKKQDKSKAECGRLGGLAIKRKLGNKKKVSSFFSNLSKLRKTFAGGRPRKVKA